MTSCDHWKSRDIRENHDIFKFQVLESNCGLEVVGDTGNTSETTVLVVEFSLSLHYELALTTRTRLAE